MLRLPLAIIIPTFNEAANIRHALESVLGWAEQVFVVDSYSTDDTIDVALSLRGQTTTFSSASMNGNCWPAVTTPK